MTQLKGWKGSYITKHMEMTEKAKIVVKFVDQCFSNESIEVGYYQAAIENLRLFRFGFKDVEILFFKPDMNVILNLVGLHFQVINQAAKTKERGFTEPRFE